MTKPGEMSHSELYATATSSDKQKVLVISQWGHQAQGFPLLSVLAVQVVQSVKLWAKQGSQSKQSLPTGQATPLASHIPFKVELQESSAACSVVHDWLCTTFEKRPSQRVALSKASDAIISLIVFSFYYQTSLCKVNLPSCGLAADGCACVDAPFRPNEEPTTKDCVLLLVGWKKESIIDG